MACPIPIDDDISIHGELLYVHSTPFYNSEDFYSGMIGMNLFIDIRVISEFIFI